MTADLATFEVRPENSLREVMACIDANARGIALVVDEEQHLLGTVTDGDLRRAILSGDDLASPVTHLLEGKESSQYPRPVTATVDTSRTDLLRLMRRHAVRHVPLLDQDSRVVDLVILDDLLPANGLPGHAVIMAGGYGTRLQPLTEAMPKSLLTVGDRPVIDWIIEGLREAGIQHVTVTTHYKADLLTEHLADGSRLGVQVDYIHEERPRGTAGSLGLLGPWDEPLLVVNGDILTRVDYRALLHYHREHQADMTVAVREYQLEVPYGTVEVEGVVIRGVTEKPALRSLINAGIYVLAPAVQAYVAEGESLDMTDLVARLLDDGQTVVGFPVREYWIDIGQPSDYERAQRDVGHGGDLR